MQQMKSTIDHQNNIGVMSTT